MPIYEYECVGCGHQFERLVRPSGSAPVEIGPCPSCQCMNLRQLLSMFAVSSHETRQLHRDQGRRLAQKDLKEQKHAEMEAVIHHHREHEH
jgi:putative FmdB family regulatory protein